MKYRHLPSTFFSVCVIFPIVSMAAVVKGPYLQNPHQHRITIAIEVDDDSDCMVQWGDNLQNTLPMAVAGLHREGTIDGLEPSTCYRYQIQCGSDLSPEASFCTAPSSLEPFRIVIFGDTRSDHQAHTDVINAITEESPDLFFNTGDLVTDGEDEDGWNTFFDIEGSLLQAVPMMPVLGNHDEHSGEIPIYSRLFSVPTGASGVDNYYSITYGNARFIVLDNQAEALGRPEDATTQGQWLVNELQNTTNDSKADFVFVLVHENMYSVKDGRSGDEGLRLWKDKFKESGVDSVISGHDHHYARGWADNGLPFIVSGGGGAPLYDVSEDFETQGQEKDVSVWGWLPEPGDDPFKIIWTKKEHHYLVLDFQGKAVNICAKQVPSGHAGKGISFDCWTIDKKEQSDPGPNPQSDDKTSGCGCATQDGFFSLIFPCMIFLAIFLLRRRYLRNC